MSIRTTVTNTNPSGAGSFPQAVDDTGSRGAKITFSAAGSYRVTSSLYFNAGPTHVNGGNKAVSVYFDTAGGDGSYGVYGTSGALHLRNIHFDNSLGTTNRSTLLLSPADVSSAEQSPLATFKHCYFRGPAFADDCLWVGHCFRQVLYEYCVFDGTAAANAYACTVGYSDNVGPGYELVYEVTFKHCIFLAAARIPDISCGTVNLLGCIMQRIHSPGQIRGYAKVNAVNNWYLNPSDVSYNSSCLVVTTTTPVNGQNIRAESIYSSGNYQDGIAESSWVATAYAPTFYTLPNGSACPSTYFSSEPVSSVPTVPDAITSRTLTLNKAGPIVRSTNCSQAVGKVFGRRPQDVL